MIKYYLTIFFLVFSAVCFSQTDDIFIKSPYNTHGHWLFNQQYDSIGGSWSRIAPLHGSYFGSASHYINDIGKVFICGGIDSTGYISDSCYFYNIQTNSYEPKAPLPAGRYLGKLVSVRDSVYLVGSVGSNFNIPDGAMYKYDMQNNLWVVKAPVTGPIVHETAVCVWRDSLIITIGGSTNAFGGASNQVRAFDPRTNTWRILAAASNPFPVNVTSAQAECIGDEIVVVGGYNNSGALNKVYRGYTYSAYLDSLTWFEDSISTPFITGVYRIASGKYGNSMVFGPALSGSGCINQIWSLSILDNVWTKFTPNSMDTASRTSLALRITNDSMFFYLFGGVTHDSAYHFINKSEKFSTVSPLIGISGNGSTVPERFKLGQNYPNPFNPNTTIEYAVPKTSYIILKVYDITGRETAILVNENKQAGIYKVNFNASNLASGIYFYRLSADIYSETRKMVLIK
jgi:hypothetical protein